MAAANLSRRNFLAATAALGVAGAALPALAAEPVFKGKLRKALIIGAVTEGMLAPLKRAGFDGVETTNVCSEKEAEAARAVAEAGGMRVHSVLRGWMEFNSENPAKVEESLESTRAALRAAKAYGADAILLVPCRTGGMPMPEPWEFQIEFDDKTGHVTRVAAGDNEKYDAYIKAQNRATDTSRAAVEKLLPLAEELKVVIGLEDVWNNLWVSPKVYKHFVASFKSPWAKAYFDIGNVVKYSPPEDWIKELGGLIVKLHVKDFRLNPDGHGGGFVHPRDGSINWPAVRQALDEAGYDGWGTIEDGGLAPAEFVRRFDLIAAGK